MYPKLYVFVSGGGELSSSYFLTSRRLSLEFWASHRRTFSLPIYSETTTIFFETRRDRFSQGLFERALAGRWPQTGRINADSDDINKRWRPPNVNANYPSICHRAALIQY